MCHMGNHRPVELVTPAEAFVASLQTVFDSGVNRPTNSTALLTDMPTVPRTCLSFTPVNVTFMPLAPAQIESRPQLRRKKP